MSAYKIALLSGKKKIKTFQQTCEKGKAAGLNTNGEGGEDTWIMHETTSMQCISIGVNNARIFAIRGSAWSQSIANSRGQLLIYGYWREKKKDLFFLFPECNACGNFFNDRAIELPDHQMSFYIFNDTRWLWVGFKNQLIKSIFLFVAQNQKTMYWLFLYVFCQWIHLTSRITRYLVATRE